MIRGYYFHGRRLWERGLDWVPHAARTGEGDHQGARQTYATRYGGGPNYRRDISVACMIHLVDAAGTLDAADTLDAMLRKMENKLIDLSKTAGPLSRVADVNRKASVTGGAYTGDNAVVGHGAVDGGWTRTAGQYVLVRDPSTDEGFVAQIEAVDSVATDITIDVPSGYSVDSDWELVDVVAYFPSCYYEDMDRGEASPHDRSDEWRARVSYYFTSYSASVHATNDDPTMDD